MRIRLLAIPMAVVLLAGTDASAQLDKGDQGCINALNKGGRGVEKARAKEIQACIKNFAKGKIGNAETCVPDDPKGKVGKARGKTDASYTKKCGGSPPAGIPLDPTQINDASEAKEFLLYGSVFGSGYNTSIITESTDKNTSKCQQAISKDLLKAVVDYLQIGRRVLLQARRTERKESIPDFPGHG